MSVEWIRAQCLALPHSTEHMQWGDNLVFKVAAKVFAIAPLSPSGRPSGSSVSLKCTPDDFAELTERPGIIQAPYLARGKWVTLESPDALPRAQIKQLLGKSYQLVVAKLPKKTQAALAKPQPKRLKSRS